ncbi:MAG: diadenylate cyclase CdaA [Butyricicoccus pullicaecorum]|nr:diadenylate cyclase CdaA [Butyricicoccus pullicaecorum]MDO4669140.1 diadenylate cyclase CdaA [Butyricicoccus pullicaecorum]
MADALRVLMRSIQLISIQDVIDMGIMAYVIYRGMKLLKDTSAMRLAKGILIIFITQIVAENLQLNTVSWILRQVFSFGALFLAIVFQPELRRMLEQLGKGQGQLRKFLTGTEVDIVAIDQCINQTVLACESMSWTRTGALMVFERQERISEIINTGTRIDAEPSAELIKNIFFHNSPLHDGALVVRDGRLFSAGCVLPLSGNQTLSRDLGTRHRAAVGMSEVSDAVLVVVSEETGAISVAIGGMLKRHLSPETLRKILVAELTPEEKTETPEKRKGFLQRKPKKDAERKGKEK